MTVGSTFAFVRHDGPTHTQSSARNKQNLIPRTHTQKGIMCIVRVVSDRSGLEVLRFVCCGGEKILKRFCARSTTSARISALKFVMPNKYKSYPNMCLIIGVLYYSGMEGSLDSCANAEKFTFLNVF